MTVAALADYVNDAVAQWSLRRSSGYHAGGGIERELEGSVGLLPLAYCLDCAVHSQPATLELAGERLRVKDAEGELLWGHSVSGRINQGVVGDLDGDRDREVIVGVGGPGDDAGKVLAYGCGGAALWSRDTSSGANYGAGSSGRMAVRQLALADLFGQDRQQVVVLASEAAGGYPARLCVFDSDGTPRGAYWHPGRLDRLAIGAVSPGNRSRILVAGGNNDLRSHFPGEQQLAVLFMLDPGKVSGEAPPGLGASGKGSQVWYGALLPRGLEVAGIELGANDPNGARTIMLRTSRGDTLSLDIEGRVLDRKTAAGTQEEVDFVLVSEKARPHSASTAGPAFDVFPAATGRRGSSTSSSLTTSPARTAINAPILLNPG